MPQMPWVAFYFSDFLNDRAVRLMTYDERGRYLEVLAVAYQNPEPGIMLEDEVRRAADYTPGEWPEHREAFARAFFVVDDGVWVQKRVVAEAQKAGVIVKARSEAGRRGNDVRWAKHRKRIANGSQTDPNRDRKDIAKSSTATATATENLEPKTLGHRAMTGTDGGELFVTEPQPEQLTVTEWFEAAFWPLYPKKVKKPTALKAMLRAFKGLSGPAEDALGEAIIAGVKRYAKVVDGKDRQFILHPASWLNNRSWEDEDA